MRVRTAKSLVLILLVALALRWVAAGIWQARLDGPFGFGDSLSYWHLAQDLAQGEPYRYGGQMGWIFRTPGYPLLLAPIFWVAGPDAAPLWGRAMGGLFGAAAVAGVWWLGRRLFSPATGLIAAGIAAVYPGAVVTSALILSETPFSTLMLAQLILWIEAWRNPAPRRAGLWAFGSGVVAGAATLVRPSWLLFLPFAVLVFLVASGRRRRNLALGAVMMLGMVVLMAPWWIRNARLTGHFVATTLQMGASLYDGWNPHATGASNMDFVAGLARTLQQDTPSAASPYPAALEYELDRGMRAAALSWASQHPGRVLQLALVKFTRIWNFWPNEAALASWPVRTVTVVTYVPVLVLGIVGVVWTTRRGVPYVLCWLPAVYLTLLHMVFVSSIRYREPAMLGLIVLAAGVLGFWLNAGKEERNSRED